MTGQATSLGVARGFPEQWRRFGAFLRRPALRDAVADARGSLLRLIVSLAGLDLLLMVLLLGALGVASTLGWDAPGHVMQQFELQPALIGFILVAAPVVEELLFRGWLSGKPGHVGALVVLLAAGAAAWALAQMAGTIAAALAVVAGAIGALVVIWRKRGEPPMVWFQRHFTSFYWLSAVAFALAHLVNFAEGAGAFTVILVLPQFVLGLILGYLRVTSGLGASIALHAMHNSFFLGLALLASSAA